MFNTIQMIKMDWKGLELSDFSYYESANVLSPVSKVSGVSVCGAACLHGYFKRNGDQHFFILGEWSNEHYSIIISGVLRGPATSCWSVTFLDHLWSITEQASSIQSILHPAILIHSKLPRMNALDLCPLYGALGTRYLLGEDHGMRTEKRIRLLVFRLYNSLISFSSIITSVLWINQS